MTRIIYTGNKPDREISEIFSDTMSELIENDPDVVYIDSDLMSSMKSKGLWQKYPENVFNTGIQEANMIGVAAGMYLYGKKPYVHSFAPFATRRCYDQTFISIGYARKSIRIIGSDPGICATDNGGTHMTFEDVCLIRMIPESTVVDISDGHEFSEILKITKDRQGVIYIRTPRRNLPDIYDANEQFEIGKAKKLYDGNDCTVIASGIMTSTAIEATKILREEGIYIDLIDPVCVKPLDKNMILNSARKTNKVVTVENHSIYGGLGGAISELLSSEYPVSVKKIGIDEEFGQVGDINYLRRVYHLTTKDVIQEIRKFCQEC